MTLNPFEMLGETIQGLSRISHEIEKMPEFVAARFFDVEYASDFTDKTIDDIHGKRAIEQNEVGAVALEASQSFTPQIVKPAEATNILSEETPALSAFEQRRYVREALEGVGEASDLGQAA